MKKLFIIVILAFIFTLTSERLFRQQFTFPTLRRNKGWTFLDRMKLGQGYAQVRLNIKMQTKEGQTSRTYGLQLVAVPDRLWNAEQLMKCSKQETTEAVPQSVTQQQNSPSSTIFSAILNPENKYDFGFLQTFNIPRTETYHFILKDCNKSLISDYFSRDSRLILQLQVRNNGRDYGQDEQGNFYWFPLLIIGTIIMLKVIDKNLSSKALDTKQTDYVKILVISCIWINLISLVFKYIGYLIYCFSGSEYGFFDFMYLFFHSVGDSVIVSIFIFVSFGWTITFINGKDFDLYVPLVCMMGLISVILTLLNKITDGSHDKYHMYDTIPAYLMVFFKFITIIIFLVGCIKTIYQSKKDKKVRAFMIELMILGGIYISSVPIVMLAVQYLPPSSRKEWVFILIELGKTFIIFLLTYMISYKKSGYRTISYGEQSFMQQNGRVL